MNNERIGVIGAGSWGTALSKLLAENGNDVDLWVYEEDLCALMRQTRENKLYLPGVSLPKTIHPTNTLKEAVRGKSALVLVVPSHIMRATADRIREWVSPDCLLINASKGIENDSLCTVNQVLQETLPSAPMLVTISGPTFAMEVASRSPSAMVSAAQDIELAERVSQLFSTDYMKVFTSNDPLGVELGGSLKNVIAIATGISDGLQLGFNARAALINRGLVEMKRIGTALGARPETFAGLSGMGDLVLTCTGDLSRNRSVGIQLGQGQTLEQIKSNMNMVAEGILTVKSAFNLKNKLQIQASIIEETYRMLYENKPPTEALKDLMKVEISTEFAGVKGLE